MKDTIYNNLHCSNSRNIYFWIGYCSLAHFSNMFLFCHCWKWHTWLNHPASYVCRIFVITTFCYLRTTNAQADQDLRCPLTKPMDTVSIDLVLRYSHMTSEPVFTLRIVCKSISFLAIILDKLFCFAKIKYWYFSLFSTETYVFSIH